MHLAGEYNKIKSCVPLHCESLARLAWTVIHCVYTGYYVCSPSLPKLVPRAAVIDILVKCQQFKEVVFCGPRKWFVSRVLKSHRTASLLGPQTTSVFRLLLPLPVCSVLYALKIARKYLTWSSSLRVKWLLLLISSPLC